MQIVIDISDHYYDNIKEELPIILSEDNIIAILPKGHGRLIDERQITKCGWNFIDHHAKTNAPAIIETDKEVGNGEINKNLR